MFGKVTAVQEKSSTHERAAEIEPSVKLANGFNEFTLQIGDGQNTDPQSMDYPNGLPKWTTPKNTISDEYYIKKLRFYTYTARIDLHIFVPHGLQPPF